MAWYLANTRDPGAITALIDMAKGDPVMDLSSAMSLATLEDEHANTIFTEMLLDKNPSRRVVALRGLGMNPIAVPTTIELCKAGTTDSILYAIYGLGELRDPRAAGVLLELSVPGKPDWQRRYAAHALGVMQDARGLERILDALEEPEINDRFADKGMLPEMVLTDLSQYWTWSSTKEKTRIRAAVDKYDLSRRPKGATTGDF